jgi:outer membrane protein insertion porin family
VSARRAWFFAVGCAFVGVTGCPRARPPTTTGASTTTTATTSAAPIVAASSASCTTAKATPGADTIVRVDVEGNVRTPTKAICDYLRTKAGDVFDAEWIARDVRELFHSGFMDDVEVFSQITDEGRTVTFRMRERPRVKEFVLTATAWAPSKDHLEELFGKAGDIFDMTRLRRATARLREEYLDEGYRAADVGYVATPLPGNEVTVAITVTPGAKQLVTSIRFPGAKQITEAELLAVIDKQHGKAAVGGVYRQDAFERALVKMNELYFDRGMVTVKVGDPELTPSSDKTGVAVVVPIEEGPVFKVGKLSCVGDLAGPEKQCLELLGVKKGDVFSRSALVAGITRIRDFQKLKGHGDEVEPATEIDTTKKIVDLKLTIAK